MSGRLWLRACGEPSRDVAARRARARAGGFTVLELLLAAAITFVMVLFLHTIFRTISRTVSLGLATSDIIRSNSDFTAQLSADSDALVGPLGGGFLVVLQKELPNVRLRPGDAANSTLRSDQIIWIRDVGGQGVTPATPASASSYSQATSAATHARVWYGHVLKTDEAGASATPLGVPGPNEIACQWVLGRQLMFLDPAPNSAVHIKSTDAFPKWTVTGYDSEPAAPTDAWYKGLSDIFDADLNALLTYFDNGMGGGVGYPAGPYQFTYGWQRLWCNPRSLTAPTASTWRMAQMHPYYVANVSDFRVDFAGSFDGIPVVGTDLINKPIKWYSHFYNNPTEGGYGGKPYDPDEPITYKPPVYVFPLPGGFAPADDPLQLPGLTKPIYQTNPMPHADGAFTFFERCAEWPHLVRLRYRVHDNDGQIADRDVRPGKIFERVMKVKGL